MEGNRKKQTEADKIRGKLTKNRQKFTEIDNNQPNQTEKERDKTKQKR